MSSSLEITWPKNKKLPYVDIESFWNIDDVVPFKRLLPKKYINPNLYDWIQEAFLSGSVKNGKMKIAGMLENFPFKERTGIFQVRAKAEDMVLNYARNWPDAKIISMDFELDSDHIFSLKNQSIHKHFSQSLQFHDPQEVLLGEVLSCLIYLYPNLLHFPYVAI